MSGCVYVVVTGPSGAGKSTVVGGIAQWFRESGLRVLEVPEAATALMRQSKVSFRTLNPVVYEQVQRSVIAYQRDQRWTAQRLATTGLVEMIVFDRAEFDGIAYTAEGAVEEVLAERGETVAGVFSQYDQVLFLEPGPVEYDSNPERYESEDVAMRRGQALLDTWSCHPRFVKLPWAETPSQRVQRAVAAMTRGVASPS